MDVHKGIGTITKDKNVLVNGSELLETKKIILAGGSKVSKINVPGMESSLVMTSDDTVSYTHPYIDSSLRYYHDVIQQGVELNHIAIRIQSGAIHHEEAWAEHLPECLRFLAENWD